MGVRAQLTSPQFWLAVCVVAGIAHMALGGAPLHYMVINGIALGFALAMLLFVRGSVSWIAVEGIAAGAVIFLFAPLFIGPNIDGVQRWLGWGSLQLHSGMLVLPLFVSIVARLKFAHQMVAIALASLAVTLQPDRASAIALLAGMAAHFWATRSWKGAALMLFAVCAVVATLGQPDVLEPVRFVENVLRDAGRESPLVAIILSTALVAALVIPVLLNRKYLPIAATISGFAFAALFGAYPTPLIGYGAASILGYGFALAAERLPRISS